MARSPDQSVQNREAARPPGTFAAVPGWLLSGGFHAAILAIIISTGLPSCGDGQPGSGNTDDGMRDVGIHVKQPKSKQTPTEPQVESTPQTVETTNPPQPDPSPVDVVPEDLPAVADALAGVPQIDAPSVIGLGQPDPLASNPPTVAPPSTNLSDGGLLKPSQGQGPGEVSFMGIKSTAKKIVFVIDSSGSMSGYNAMDFAKSQLIQSINRLDASQEFQIIDYNTTVHVMTLHGKQGFQLYRADSHNKVLAVRYVNTIRPDAGTRYSPALLKAMEVKPNVIYFLTDADSQMTDRKLEILKLELRKQRGLAIHCIQFGKGPDLGLEEDNWLRRLAALSRGSFVYRDVREFQPR